MDNALAEKDREYRAEKERVRARAERAARNPRANVRPRNGGAPEDMTTVAARALGAKGDAPTGTKAKKLVKEFNKRIAVYTNVTITDEATVKQIGVSEFTTVSSAFIKSGRYAFVFVSPFVGAERSHLRETAIPVPIHHIEGFQGVGE
ncbi:MAG: hypothetical protein IPF79_04805 [Ignavibacteria bacterium]|nr:hypothetical protein [Ignavibacteria bacterium]